MRRAFAGSAICTKIDTLGLGRLGKPNGHVIQRRSISEDISILENPESEIRNPVSVFFLAGIDIYWIPLGPHHFPWLTQDILYKCIIQVLLKKILRKHGELWGTTVQNKCGKRKTTVLQCCSHSSFTSSKLVFHGTDILSHRNPYRRNASRIARLVRI